MLVWAVMDSLQRHLNSAHCWLDQDKLWKTRTSLCNTAHKSCSVYEKQMVTLFGVYVLCGVHSNSNQVFLKGLMPALLLQEKRSAIGTQSDRQTLTTATLPSIYSILEMCCHAAQTLPILRALRRSIEYEGDESGRREFHSVEGHVLRERKHMLHFFEQKRCTNRRLTWCVPCDDWMPNNGGLK